MTIVEEGKLNQIRTLRTDGISFADEACAQDFSGYQFYECTFSHVTFSGRLSGILFVDVIFDHCDFSNCDMEEAVFRRVQMKGCRLTEIGRAHV